MRPFRSIRFRRGLVFLFDLVTIGVAFVGAFLLRFDFNIPADHMLNLTQGLPWIYLIQASVFIWLGLYRGLWAFASIRDLFVIIRGVFLGVTLSLAGMAMMYHRLVGWPRSVFLLDGVLLIIILGGGRFTYRFLREVVWTHRNQQKRTLVIGAGQSANLIAREFCSRPELSARIIGFLDDNPKLKGFRIQGAPVLGNLDQLPHFLEKYHAHEVIIAIPSLPGARLKKILATTRTLGVPCRICPPIRDVLLGRVQLNQLREVRVEDLLRRDVLKVDDSGLEESFSGRRILVTGAGGSIGSELCRQILKYNPRSLVMYERSEFNLYRFEQELKRSNSTPLANLTDLSFVVGDILDETRLSEIFRKYSPEIVLHAAAFKHVPLMEENIYEALRNNVLGTYRLFKCSAENGVKDFILISTDKAVRPTSIMGATKRMAELVAHSLAARYPIRSTAVRFGNVLDSEGSVLPLFREQISQGGPVTVTHPEITRYFMTIPEASLLVLQASILGRGGEIFLLDMGEPVLIRELAEEMIKLSGLEPYHDIDILFTGLRKGEKLYEELLIDLTHAQRTSHPKIMASTQEHLATLPQDWESELLSFSTASTLLDEGFLVGWIKAWVPEYLIGMSGSEAGAGVEGDLENEEAPSPSMTESSTYLH